MNEMREKIAFIAIGQAGGNIGQEFEERGFSVVYINTSEEDLATLDKAKFKYHIPGGEGCNKDRTKAKKLIVENYDRIAAEIDAKINAELIFTLFSSGGGTGSGAGPMLTDLLIGDGHNVGIVTVIPAMQESVKAHINCHDCMAELTSIKESAACFALDNGKADKMEINRIFAELFTDFISIPQQHKSAEGNIDKAEVLETLFAHGTAVIFKSKDQTGLLDCIKSGIYAPIESDRAVKYIAASGNADMDDLIKELGTPVDFYQTKNNDDIIVCASGMTYPVERIKEVEDKVKSNEETIKKNLASTLDTEIKGSINFLDSVKSPEPAKEKNKSRRDILNKYLT